MSYFIHTIFYSELKREAQKIFWERLEEEEGKLSKEEKKKLIDKMNNEGIAHTKLLVY